MALPIHTEQRFSIRPTYIVSTPIYTGGSMVRSKAQRLSEANLRNNGHNGQLSDKAAKRIRNAINWLVHSSRFKRVWSRTDNRSYWFKVNFITLTFPTLHNHEITGKEVSECLHTFLVYARKYFYLHNYVWKIERGAKGKLHIHLTTDTYIHYRLLRDSWNRILLKRGLSDSYFEKHGHYDPNSTDVHAVRKIKNVAGYMAEYMTKGSDLGESFKNRIWGCSQSLSEKNKCQYIADSGELSDVVKSLLSKEVRWKAIHSKPDSLGATQRIGEIFFCTERTWLNTIRGKIKDTYANHIQRIRDGTPQIPINYLMNDVIEPAKCLLVPVKTNEIQSTLQLSAIKQRGAVQTNLILQ